jgi:hypothetical protein
MTPWVIVAVAVLVVVAAVVAVVVAGAGTQGIPEPAARPVAISGSILPTLVDPANDPAVGQPVPALAGTGLDGEPVEIGPGDGPMAIVVLAHWCPHCRAELPGLVDAIARGAVPDGVTVVGLSTAIDPARPNFPPSSWIEREGWTQPTLVDDANRSALEALGLDGFPGFVFVDADGAVVGRLTGEIGAASFAEILRSLAPA